MRTPGACHPGPAVPERFLAPPWAGMVAASRRVYPGGTAHGGGKPRCSLFVLGSLSVWNAAQYKPCSRRLSNVFTDSRPERPRLAA